MTTTTTSPPYERINLREVAHLREKGTQASLCGLGMKGRQVTARSQAAPVCGNCARVRDRRLASQYDTGRASRAPQVGAVRLLHTAKVFRVDGTTDIYTVTVAFDERTDTTLTICTCYDGKVNPTVMCKHQVRVLGSGAGAVDQPGPHRLLWSGT